MLIRGVFFLISSVPLLALSKPSRDFQSVKFVPSKKQNAGNVRLSRHIGSAHSSPDISDYFSFTLAQPEATVWTENSPSSNDIRFDVHNNGHVTPDFSDGLSYPDPFLLVGLAAKRAATYLYSRQLFFGDIPHQRAVLHNQELRRRNGLSGHKLGSLNTRSPWIRQNGLGNFARQDRGRSGFGFNF